jgi:dTDP-3-amino-3,4,6-trideoxy-alpha-D-glucose transaminase
MHVPYFDFKLAPDELKRDWRNSLIQVMDSYDLVLGSKVSEFESAWANYINVKFAVGVGNGLDGLVLALKALGLKKGFKVAVPAHTFIASWSAIHFAGGVPVGVDVDSDGLLNLDLLEKMKDVPEVVMPVHMHGRMVDMARLCAWANKNKSRIVEDASQSHGASLHGTSAGAWGDVSVFSLYPSKNLGAFGDAGVVCTSEENIAISLRQLRNYGASESNKYFHEVLGSNSRLDTIQAGILLVNINHLVSWNERRREISERYLSGLVENSDMTLPRGGGSEMVWHHFAIWHQKRANLIGFLNQRKIETQIHYPRSAGIEFDSFLSQKSEYKNAEKIASQTLSLPISPWHSQTHIDTVIEAINEFNEK